MKEYSQKEMWDIYEQLPEELQNAIWSPKTAEHVRNACKRSNVKDDKIPTVAKLTGRVLMGLLTPKELKSRFQEEIGLNEEEAENMYREVNRFIFMPVRETLAELYEMEIEPTKKARRLEGEEVSRQEKRGPDKYREPIE